jgi:hypothetical protein
MFTQRHYVELARLLKNSNDLEDFETLLVHYFAVDNPKFDLNRFAKASKRDTPELYRKLLNSLEVAKLVASQHK